MIRKPSRSDAVLTASGSDAAAASLRRGLRLLLPIIEGGGSPHDSVRGSKYATSGTVAWSRRAYGMALDFPDSGNLTVADAANIALTGAFSCAFYGSFDATAGDDDHVFGFYDSGGAFTGWGVALQLGFIRFWDGTAWRDSTIAPRDGITRMYSVTYTGAEVWFFRNGIRIATVAAATVGSYTGAKRLGGRSDGEATRDLKGVGGLFAIWNRALTDGEHAQLARDPFALIRRARRPRRNTSAAAAATTYRFLSLLGAGT